MKLKHGKIALWCTMTLFALLRILQYILVIDEDGFFIRDNMGQMVLADLLYWLMGAAAICGFALRWNRQNKVPAISECFRTKATLWWSVAAAAVLALYGISELFDGQWIGIFALFATIYFLLLALHCDGKNVKLLNFTSLFALAYPCAAAIKMFFDTFRLIKASENVVDMVARCAMILMMIVLTKLFMNFEEKIGRVAWGMWLYAAFGTLAGICKLFGLLSGDGLTLQMLLLICSDIVLWGMAIYLYHRCLTAQEYAAQLPPESAEETAEETAEDTVEDCE